MNELVEEMSSPLRVRKCSSFVSLFQYRYFRSQKYAVIGA
jgi:hypothetical protein